MPGTCSFCSKAWSKKALTFALMSAGGSCMAERHRAEGYDVDPESGQVTLLNWRARVLTS